MLKAIIEALHDEIRWPDAAERALLKEPYQGLFRDVVGIMDATEWFIVKYGDSVRERDTFSGKAQTNTKKTLAVIDRYGYFHFISKLIDGKHNDREQYTMSDLYMSAGRYFSEGEKLASDGGYSGDGNLVISFDLLDD